MTKNDAFAQRMVGFALDRGWKPNEVDLAPFMEGLVKSLEIRVAPESKAYWKVRNALSAIEKGACVEDVVALLQDAKRLLKNTPECDSTKSKFNSDPEWMRKKAELEDGCFVSVGGLICDLEPTTPESDSEKLKAKRAALAICRELGAQDSDEGLWERIAELIYRELGT